MRPMMMLKASTTTIATFRKPPERHFSYLSLGRYDPKTNETGLAGLQHLDSMLKLVIEKKPLEQRNMQDVLSRVEAFTTLGKHYHSGGHPARAAGYFQKALEECKFLAETRAQYLQDLYATGDSRKQMVPVGSTSLVARAVRAVRKIRREGVVRFLLGTVQNEKHAEPDRIVAKSRFLQESRIASAGAVAARSARGKTENNAKQQLLTSGSSVARSSESGSPTASGVIRPSDENGGAGASLDEDAATVRTEEAVAGVASSAAATTPTMRDDVHQGQGRPAIDDEQQAPYTEQKMLQVVEKLTGEKPSSEDRKSSTTERKPEQMRDALLNWLEDLPIDSMLAECQGYVGLCLMTDKQQHDEAEYQLRAALDSLHKAQRWQQLRQTTTAVQAFNENVTVMNTNDLTSQFAEAYNNLGACLQQREQYQKAVDYYTIALEKLIEYYQGDENNRFVCLTYYNLACCKWYLNGGGREEIQKACDLSKRMFEIGDPQRTAIDSVASLLHPSLTTTQELRQQFQDPAEVSAKERAERMGALEELMNANAERVEAQNYGSVFPSNSASAETAKTHLPTEKAGRQVAEDENSSSSTPSRTDENGPREILAQTSTSSASGSTAAA
ncbi:unnamed protein product [Amoebophrya sp. A120]|nr:unnamed protein product [Amoebophrya sp. A120]|eukprot:GSA120T00017225001.1